MSDVKTENLWLMKGDCLERMKEIHDGSVDLILTDPPYGTTACKWDSIIPLDQMWSELKRIVKPNGAVVLFGAQPFTSMLVCSNLAWYKYDWIWQKPKGTGHLNAKKQPMRDKEDVSVFYDKQCTYNPQMSVGTPYKNKAGKDHNSSSSTTDCYGSYTNFRNENKGARYPKTVLQFGVVERGSIHPTQKPVALLEYLIRTYTNEGEAVLDFTAGSMSTAIACINTNRKGIMIEKDEYYFKVGSDRVAQTLQEQDNDNIWLELQWGDLWQLIVKDGGLVVFDHRLPHSVSANANRGAYKTGVWYYMAQGFSKVDEQWKS